MEPATPPMGPHLPDLHPNNAPKSEIPAPPQSKPTHHQQALVTGMLPPQSLPVMSLCRHPQPLAEAPPPSSQDRSRTTEGPNAMPGMMHKPTIKLPSPASSVPQPDPLQQPRKGRDQRPYDSRIPDWSRLQWKLQAGWFRIWTHRAECPGRQMSWTSRSLPGQARVAGTPIRAWITSAAATLACHPVAMAPSLAMSRCAALACALHNVKGSERLHVARACLVGS